MMADHTGDNSYDGSFVLYNYARLATLENNYLKGKEKGNKNHLICLLNLM